MTRFRFRHLTVAVVLAGVAAPAGAQPGYTLEPPAEIRGVLDKLRRGEDRTPTTNPLPGRDEAAPYLRMELVVAAGPRHKQDVAAALAAITERIDRRNRPRFAAWAEGRRFDLCADLLVECPDNKTAVQLVDIVTPHLHATA